MCSLGWRCHSSWAPGGRPPDRADHNGPFWTTASHGWLSSSTNVWICAHSKGIHKHQPLIAIKKTKGKRGLELQQAGKFELTTSCRTWKHAGNCQCQPILKVKCQPSHTERCIVQKGMVTLVYGPSLHQPRKVKKINLKQWLAMAGLSCLLCPIANPQ